MPAAGRNPEFCMSEVSPGSTLLLGYLPRLFAIEHTSHPPLCPALSATVHLWLTRCFCALTQSASEPLGQWAQVSHRPGHILSGERQQGWTTLCPELELGTWRLRRASHKTFQIFCFLSSTPLQSPSFTWRLQHRSCSWQSWWQPWGLVSASGEGF